MTFPQTPIDVTVEMLLGVTWTDITGDVLVRDGIDISRGGGGEGGTAGPSQCTLTLNNRAGKYSPRNPLGPYYGMLGLNTQLRVTVDSSSRFWGEISELPPRWDMSTRDAYVPITASGILRRIGQWARVAVGGLKQFYLSTSPVTYWPLDEGSETAIGIGGVPAAGTYTGSRFRRQIGVAVASFGDGVLGTHLAPGLRINDTAPVTGFDTIQGSCVGSNATPDAIAMDFVYRADPEISGDGSALGLWLVELTVDGTAANSTDQWTVQFSDTPARFELLLNTDIYGSAAIVVSATSATLAAITDGLLHHVRMQLTQNGSNVDYALYVDGTSVISGTRNTHTLRRTRSADVVYDRPDNNHDLLCFGHLIIWENAANIPSVTDASGNAHGHIGEAAGRRFERLCDEVDIPFTSEGNLDDTLAMGAQFEDSLTGQIAEVETTDQGMIYEPRDSLALGYRTRTSLLNQSPALTLNFTALQLTDPFEPVDDDQHVRNDVFAQRRDGASYQATLGTGRLSVQNPPNGVGRYKDEVQVNVETDDDLPGVGGWLLLLGTTDEARYPQIVVDRAGRGVAPDPSLSAAVMTADVGDRIVVTGTRPLGIYNDISQIIVGYSETITPFGHRHAFACVPASPYEVLELDGVNSWLDPGTASTLSSSATSTATSLSVATTGFLWSTSGSNYPVPLLIDGEEMTLTAVSGASSPQTFTVTRSVNGVVKAHTSGAQVSLKRPGILGL